MKAITLHDCRDAENVAIVAQQLSAGISAPRYFAAPIDACVAKGGTLARCLQDAFAFPHHYDGRKGFACSASPEALPPWPEKVTRTDVDGSYTDCMFRRPGRWPGATVKLADDEDRPRIAVAASAFVGAHIKAACERIDLIGDAARAYVSGNWETVDAAAEFELWKAKRNAERRAEYKTAMDDKEAANGWREAAQFRLFEWVSRRVPGRRGTTE